MTSIKNQITPPSAKLLAMLFSLDSLNCSSQILLRRIQDTSQPGSPRENTNYLKVFSTGSQSLSTGGVV